MASTADIPKYEEMIAAIGKFIGEVDEASAEMAAAGSECVENCGNDSASTTSNAKLAEHIGKFSEATEAAGRVQAALQEQLEELYELQKIENEINSD